MLPNSLPKDVPIGAQPTTAASSGQQNSYGYPDTAPNSRPVFLLPHHQDQLSAISADVQHERGYRSEVTPAILAQNGFCRSNGKAPKWVSECVPALFIPVHNAAGDQSLVQIRPDNPRFKADGKPVKYETPPGFKICVDVHPRIRRDIANPLIDLWITEGVKDADAAISRGLCCPALLGVWNWRGTNDAGGATALADWEQFAFKHQDGTARRVFVAFDSDVSRKPAVAAALKRFVAWLEFKGAKATVVYLPDGKNGEKTGLTEFFERDGGTVETLHELADADVEKAQPQPEAPAPKTLSPDEIRAAFKEAAGKVSAPCSLAEVKTAFKKWLYLRDDSLIEVTLAAFIANLVDGDPAWLMIVGGSSSGKTEVVNPLAALPFTHLVGTLTEASFLSGSSKRDQTADSTGGLLREVGDFGILLLKDFTSILSIHHDKRMAILAALREVYDGSWSKRGGNDGGKNLSWTGKAGVIACCTDAIESATAVTNSMGERFMRYRWHHSDADQKEIARRAMRRGGGDAQMRAEMREAVCGFFGQLDLPANPAPIDEATEDKLIALATFTARGRSVVDRAATGGRDIELIHDSEVPARFGVMIRRMYSALQILGIGEKQIWRILEKIALDSIPKLRGEIIRHFREQRLNGNCELLAGSVAKAVKSSPTATRRALEELRAHDIFSFAERQTERGPTHFWSFSDFGLELLECGFSTLPEKSYEAHPNENTNENLNFLETVPDDFSGRVGAPKRETQRQQAAAQSEPYAVKL